MLEKESKRVEYWKVDKNLSNTFGMHDEVTVEQVFKRVDDFKISLKIEDLMKFEQVDTVEAFLHAVLIRGMERLVRDYSFKQLWNSLDFNYDKKEELFRVNSSQANDITELKKEIARLKERGGSEWS